MIFAPTRKMITANRQGEVLPNDYAQFTRIHNLYPFGQVIREKDAPMSTRKPTAACSGACR
jgi:hypothetical protein